MVLEDEENDRGIDHQTVGERVGDPAEVGLDVPAAGEPAIDLVGDSGGGEDDRRAPALASVRGNEQDDEDRDQRQPQDRERVRDARQRSGDRGGGHRDQGYSAAD